MLTLVLEGSIMLSLNVHVNSTLILLGELTVRALELARLGTDILEGHFDMGDFPHRVAKNSIFWSSKINHNFRMVCLKKIRIETRELQKAGVLEYYINQGFSHITRLYPRTPSKFPTVGCLVELSHYKQRDGFLINSMKGKQLIYRLSYM